MRIDIHASGFALTDPIQSHMQRRIAFALDRLRGRIRRVSVRLSDINGRRGGVDKRCQLHVHLTSSADVVVADVQPDLYVAMSRAVDRAAAVIVRRIERLRRSQARIALSQLPERPVESPARPAREKSG